MSFKMKLVSQLKERRSFALVDGKHFKQFTAINHFRILVLQTKCAYFVFPTSKAWKATLIGPFATFMVVLHSSLLGYGSG